MSSLRYNLSVDFIKLESMKTISKRLPPIHSLEPLNGLSCLLASAPHH